MDLVIIFFLAALLGLLITFVIAFSFATLLVWQEAHLKILNSGRNRSIWLISFAAFSFCFLGFCLRINGFRWSPVWHKSLLIAVFCYTSIFFNPQVNFSNAKDNDTTYCPDGYAFKLENDHYIKCEDFDAYFEARHNGKVRNELWIK